MQRAYKTIPALLVAVSTTAPGVSAQSGGSPEEVEAYYRAVAEHFRVPTEEVLILAGWELPPEHVPVLLTFAGRAGISADALAALKRGGRPWLDVGKRYGVHAGLLHVPLPDGHDGGSLAAAYRAYASTPSNRWSDLELRDSQVVGLVNVRVLSDILRIPPAEVLAAADRTGSYVAAYNRLLRR